MFAVIPTAIAPSAPSAPAEAVAPPATTRWPAIALAFGTAAAAVWIGAALLSAGHGFDLTDEGFYLLSYRWWRDDHRNFTGAAYLYGPVFQLLGWDIAGLRLVRLLTVVAVHLIFGWTVMRWLRPRRPAAAPTRLWEAAGTAAIVAAGGAIYGWLPQSPGYNDVVLLGALLATAVVLAMDTAAGTGARVGWWRPAALGVLAVPVLLAKWAALPLVLLLGAAAVVVLWPAGVRGVARALLAGLSGAALTVAAVHLLLVPLTTALPQLIEVNRLLAGDSMSLPVLLDRYWSTSLPMIEAAVLHYGTLMLGGGLAAVARGPVTRMLGGIIGTAGLALAVRHAVQDGGLGGGAINVLAYIVPLLAVLGVTLVVGLAAAVRERAGAARSWLLLAVLVLVPVVQATGTGNIPLKVVVDGFAFWMAVLIAVLTRLARDAVAARRLTAAVGALALVATAAVATGGLWRHPYRGVPRDQATATAAGVPALDSVRVDPAAARGYAGLRQRLAPYLEPEGRAVIGFDKMAGILLLLDARTVGEVWYASNDRARSAAGIVAACSGGAPWWGDRDPIVLYNRPVRASDLRALQTCGLNLRTGYRLLAPAGETMGLSVYVPAAEPAR